MTNFSPLDNEATLAERIKAELLGDDPDLDERTFLDTLEGATNIMEMLGAAVRTAVYYGHVIEMQKRRKAELELRQERTEAEMYRLRDKVRDIMLRLDIKQLRQDDFTASLRATAPKVIVTDETLIPVDYWEMRPHLNKQFLLDRLKDGAQVDGATLSNSGMSLAVRTK